VHPVTRPWPIRWVLPLLLGYVCGAQAADTALEITRHYLEKAPLGQWDETITLESAQSIQDRWVSRLTQTLGPIIGYKAGLTNPEVQRRFGVSQPIRGTLLQGMLLPSGSVLPARFGAVPMSEGDVLVRVGDAALNEAVTPEQALAAIEAVIPFLELPDLLFDPGVKAPAPALVAINVGARLGIVGEPIAVQAAAQWRDRLRTFRLQLLDEQDKLLAEGEGNQLMGDPLHVVLWLRDSLRAEGKRLEQGHLLSLGSVTRLLPVQPGSVIRARYIGLDPLGPREISIRFQ
jgi:2-keto-4-pentenoate hydratase